jgi:hypothetical protein
MASKRQKKQPANVTKDQVIEWLWQLDPRERRNFLNELPNELEKRERAYRQVLFQVLGEDQPLPRKGASVATGNTIYSKDGRSIGVEDVDPDNTFQARTLALVEHRVCRGNPVASGQERHHLTFTGEREDGRPYALARVKHDGFDEAAYIVFACIGEQPQEFFEAIENYLRAGQVVRTIHALAPLSAVKFWLDLGYFYRRRGQVPEFVRRSSAGEPWYEDERKRRDFWDTVDETAEGAQGQDLVVMSKTLV